MLYYVGPSWVQIVHLPHKRFFNKTDCYYCLPNLFFHDTFQKNPQRANHGTEGCIISVQIGCELFPQKGYFLEKLTIGLTTLSNHATSFQKNHHRANHENKVA